jgi:hypothetical protein
VPNAASNGAACGPSCDRQEDDDGWHHITCDSRVSAVRRSAYIAAQQKLGLLSDRRHRCAFGYCRRPVAATCDLIGSVRTRSRSIRWTERRRTEQSSRELGALPQSALAAGLSPSRYPHRRGVQPEQPDLVTALTGLAVDADRGQSSTSSALCATV